MGNGYDEILWGKSTQSKSWVCFNLEAQVCEVQKYKESYVYSLLYAKDLSNSPRPVPYFQIRFPVYTGIMKLPFCEVINCKREIISENLN